jgi:hypothetical protein
MAINPNNGVLDIINGTLKVSSIDIKQAGGFTTAINTVARNDVLLYDDQHTNTTFTPTQNAGYSSSSGVTRDTTAIDFNDGWVYWPLQLPNSWHTEFDILIPTTGGVLTYSLFNTSEPNHTDYTANDGGYKIVFDNTQNQIDVRWEGSVHATTSANVRSADWQHVNINYFQGAVSISLAGKVVLTHKFTENYQEFESRYVGFSATSGASHKIRHLIVHNSDKWLYTKTSNASDISYVSGNVGIGSLSPTELLDVHGNVHIAKDLTVDGNLTVSGTTTFIDTQNLAIEDPIIEVARGNASDTIDAGLVITRPSSNVAVAYRGDEEELALGYTQSGASDTDVTPVADGGLSVRVYGNLFANNLTTTANVEATYVKGDGSELTQITLDQVVGYANTTGNTVQLTNTDVGLVATGNVEANYFVGDGSRLTGLVTTLEDVANNGNTMSNTIQFTNTTTAFVADSNVGIGTDAPTANLHVMGHQYVNDPPTIANSFDHSDAPLTLTHGTVTSDTAINDPKPILHLTREGTSGQAYGARASFNLSRYENSGTASRSRLDLALADGTYAESTVMTLRADGNVGVGTTSPRQKLEVADGHIAIVKNAWKTDAVDDQLAGKIDFHLGNNSGQLSTPVATIEAYDKYQSGGSYRGAMAFKTQGAERMRINEVGNVGIGVTAPAEKLSVQGSFRVHGGNTSTFGNDGLLHINSRSTTYGSETVALQTTIDGRALTEANPGTHGGESRNVLALQPDGGYVGIGQSTPSKKLDVSGDINFTGQLYRNGYLYSGWTEVNINSPDATSGTWHTNTNTSNWGTPKFNTTYDQYAYNDAPGYREYDIPSGMATAYVSQLQWSSGGYVDVHGVQSDGGLVFLRRINTRQLVENSNEGNPDQHDGSTITLAATGLQHYTSIRFTNKVGRFHMTGLAFTPKTNRGAEGTGMVHSAQISDLGGTSISGGAVSAATVTSSGAMYASNWFRTYGNTGWYSETHGGGWYMTDSTWVRAYNSKSVYVTGEIHAHQGDSGNAILSAYGDSQGTGRLYVGQDTIYGGGIEYNGDNSPATTGAGADYIALYRVNNGSYAWTARNYYSNNNWEFRGTVTAPTFSGNATSATTASAANSTNGNGKIVVQNGTNGGNTKGIWMWTSTDSNWGIYMGQSGSGRSLAGGTANYFDSVTSHAIRFRVANNSANGFIFENSSDHMLLGLRASDGYLVHYGPMYNSGTLESDGRIYADNGLHVRGDWLRVDGQNGLYFNSYGGGWRMTDSTWVRLYNGKHLWCENGIMGTNYRCGVGTSNPLVPLHVYGTGASLNNGNFRYMAVGGSGSGYGTWGALCASFEGGHVRSTDSFLAHNGSLNSSDERIKKEISDIDDASALETLRLIQPKTYKYKDEEKMGSDVVYGFIAQQIQEVLPYATKTLTDYLPSICEISNVTQSNVITFTNFNTNDLLSNTTIIQAHLFKGENKDLTISEIIDEHSIRVEEDLTEMLHENDTRLYIYGEQVDDFVFLKKESIFTVATAALQEVDRQLQAEKAKVATLETQLTSVLARLDALENPPS